MDEKKYVIFKLDGEKYGIEIEMVKEISEYSKLTKVPNSPPFIEGIMNLRGVIVPVINLKEKLDIDSVMKTDIKKLIVTQLNSKEIGLQVDEVWEVSNVLEENVDRSQEMINGLGSEYVNGIAKVNNQIIFLLDIVKILVNENLE